MSPRPTAEALTGRIRHRLPGRLRIALTAPPEDPQERSRLVAALASGGDVTAAELRPLTGSLVIAHDGPAEPILQRWSEAGLLTVLPAEERAPEGPVEEMLGRLRTADAAVTRLSGGRIDLVGAAFLGLVGVGLLQLARGHFAGSATSLFSQAAALAIARYGRPRPG